MTREFRTNQNNEDELVSVWTEIPAAAFPSSNGLHRHRCIYSATDRRIYVIGGEAFQHQLADDSPQTFPSTFFLFTGVRGGYGAPVQFRSRGDAG